MRYGNIEFRKNVWVELFEEAQRREKTKESSDLIPYWGLQERENMIHIERIVPMYPFSRDKAAYERLIKILSLYRLTLGQARQEELLEYFMNEDIKPEQLKKLFINLSPYLKKHAYIRARGEAWHMSRSVEAIARKRHPTAWKEADCRQKRSMALQDRRLLPYLPDR